MQVYNHDIAGLFRRIQRFRNELYKSVSSGVSQMITFDQDRLATYLGSIEGYRNWIMAQPQLDLPETHPNSIELGETVVFEPIENESVADILNLLAIAMRELVNSQSARLPCGLVPFDDSRLVAILRKMEAFLNDYIKKVTPLDLPESSPKTESTGVGRSGI